MKTDKKRGIKWMQEINKYGTLMTRVIDLETGWSANSNQYKAGSITGAILDRITRGLRGQISKKKQ